MIRLRRARRNMMFGMPRSGFSCTLGSEARFAPGLLLLERRPKVKGKGGSGRVWKDKRVVYIFGKQA